MRRSFNNIFVCLVVIMLQMVISAKAQPISATFENIIRTKMDLASAFELNGQYGVLFKDGTDLQGKAVFITMYSEERYDNIAPNNTQDDAIIYRIMVDVNTPNGTPDNPLVMEPYDYQARTYDPFSPTAKELHDGPIYSLPEPEAVRSGTDYKSYLVKEAAYNHLFQNLDPLAGKPLNVVIEIEFIGGLSFSDIDLIRLPGVNMHPNVGVTVNVYKPNNHLRKSYHFETISDVMPITSLIGDRVDFLVPVSGSIDPPPITGLPATWLAPMGREYYYHCEPSIQPGGIKPKVPFDVQSHYVSSNGAKVEYYPDWVSSATTHTYSWTAQRRTTANTSSAKYQAQYKYKKVDILGTKLQRKSKSEGQIMDFLEIYNENKTSSGNGYTYNPSVHTYYWNVDSDELLYFDTKEYNTHTPNWSGKVKRVPVYDLTSANDPYSTPTLADPSKVENEIGKLYEPWQLVREGDYTWNATDGYPQSGFAINDLVTTYRQFHDASSSTYRGYEIEDRCLYKDASGACIQASQTAPGEVSAGAVYNRQGEGPNDNNRHPGLVNLTVGSDIYSIPIEVNAPLEVDHGFYGNIITPDYSNVHADIPLTVIGLPLNMNSTGGQGAYELRLRKYSLQDFPDDKTYVLGIDGTYDPSAGTWTVTKEDIGFEQAWSATLYYNGVIIGGGEWKNTNIAYVFTTTDPYMGNQGQKCTECLDLKAGYEEFADNYVQSDRYSYDYSHGYTQSYDGETFWQRTLREYVLDLDDKKTRFVSMDALDNIWDMHGNAYYWGYRALAKQITDSELAGELKYTVTNLTSGETVEEVGRTFEFQPSDYGVGDYELQVSSLIGGDPSPIVGITVVDFDEAHPSKPERANIHTRELFAQEKSFLGLDTDPDLSKYRLAYIDDILASYKYVDGFRADQRDGSKNRFASFNDYREQYEWKTTDLSGVETDVLNIASVQSYINGFDPTSYWKPEWINWLRHFSYGKFPKSALDASAEQVSDADYRSEIAQLFDGGDFQLNDFLRALIWLAPTDYDGYRINGLMKTIVNLDEFFNNYAFSENLAPSQMAKPPVFVSQEQDLTDEDKFRIHLLRKLTNGEAIIYDASTTKNLTAYQKDHSNSRFVATNKNTDGIPLTIGQDLQTIQDYGSAIESNGKRSFPIPAAVTSYLNLYALLTNNTDPMPDPNGCATKLVDAYGGLGEDPQGNLVSDTYNQGAGPINTRQLADIYSNSDLNIGLSIVSLSSSCNNGQSSNLLADISNISQGNYDAEIDRLITFCKSRSNQTVYLRPGYEFDLVWNAGHEKVADYKAAFSYIVNKFKSQSVNNVQFVWQGSVAPFNYTTYLNYMSGMPDNRIPHNPWNLEDWYPGDDVVDIVGFSWFVNPDIKGEAAKSEFGEANVRTKRELTDKLLDLARAHNKPVMVAESTPISYDLSNMTKSNFNEFWDGPIYTQWDQNPANRIKAGTVPVTGNDIWNDFYQPLFDYVEENGDVIKYFHYINADWANEQLQWNWTSESQYWGNARVELNDEIKKKWQYEMSKPKWIHGNSLHAQSVLFVANITDTNATFDWPPNDQPPVAKFRLDIDCNVSSCATESEEFSAPQWMDSDTYSTTDLDPNTEYIATLTNVDYFGKDLGSISTIFTTSGAPSARVAKTEEEQELFTSTISIYPNPTSQGRVNVDLTIPEDGLFYMQLYDLNGQLMLDTELILRKGKNNTNLLTGSLSSGVYIINVRGKNDIHFNERLIIKH